MNDVSEIVYDVENRATSKIDLIHACGMTLFQTGSEGTELIE